MVTSFREFEIPPCWPIVSSRRRELDELDALGIHNGSPFSPRRIETYIRLIGEGVSDRATAAAVDDQIAALEIAKGDCERARGRVVRHVLGFRVRVSEDRVGYARRRGRREDVAALVILEGHDREERVFVHYPHAAGAIALLHLADHSVEVIDRIDRRGEGAEGPTRTGRNVFEGAEGARRVRRW